ncbi:hypothetical protein HF329_29640 [Chitinophaga oryzae]|uniref:DUF4136 domain-containing protein n=1 Tax=Chitinophaga oryzae TaxID=2725414 RepID=A0AAE6ZM60_9BACT|nr:hypothetical protein [Chitinophaga oryzae]QJB35242.1 hypothetical protein HF329_29640 [Chitinophaga oryzae]
MHTLYRIQLLLMLLFAGSAAVAQKISYSEPEKDDYKSTEFEIIGKVGGNILVYKTDRGDYSVSVYDADMQLKERVKLDFLPRKVISMDFVAYPDKVLMIYQFQRKDAVFSFCATMSPEARFSDAPVLIDSTRIGMYSKENKVYSMEVSEDKRRILVYKINQDKEDNNVFYTFLYDSAMTLVNNSRLSLPMAGRKQFLSNFNLTNDGDLVLSKLERTSNRDYVVSGNLVMKRALVDSFEVSPLSFKGQLLDEVKMKLDNSRHTALITAFYYKQKRGNVEGMYLYKFDYQNNKPLYEKSVVFPNDLKMNARGESNTASAFNDYFIRRIINTANGGFLLTAESFYTSSRYQPWNRWNYMYGAPYGGMYYSPYYYSPYSPLYYNPWYWNNSQGVRYHYDNVAVLSFDEEGNMQWNNFVRKSQYDDNADLYLSYLMVNIGSELRFLYNELDRRNYLLTDVSLAPGGKVTRMPTLRNLDKGFTWMPRYGKQISARTVLVPCVYRNYICFAKIDF